MTTRNLVPRATNEGKIGISTKKWAEVNATNATFTTLKVTNLKLDSEQDLSLLTASNGIEDISANASGQLVIALDDTFLSDLGLNADASKPDFAAHGTVLAADSFVTAINKLDQAVSNVADPANLDIDNFSADSITTSEEAFADNDTTLMTSAAINDRIESFGYTTNVGDITGVTAGPGLSGGGDSGAVTLSIPDQNNADNGGFDAGTFGSSSTIPVIAVNQKGIITGISTQNVATTLSINGDNDDVTTVDLLNNTLLFAGDTGISTVVSDNQISIDLNDTAVTPNSYGSATEIPTFTVDQQGRLTAAGTVGITTTLTVDSDNAGTQDVSLAEDDLQILGGDDLTSSILKNGTDVTVTLNLDETSVVNGDEQLGNNQAEWAGGDASKQYGDANTVSQFTVDRKGRLTQAKNIDISITSSQVNDATAANTEDKIVLRDGNGDFSAGTITASLTGDVTGNLTGNADTATAWATGRTIELTGDVTGTSAEFNGSGNLSFATTIAANSVALGTDTTGDYVESLVAGDGITLSNNSGEGSVPTIAVDGVLAQLDDLAELAGGDDDGKFIVATADNQFAYESGATVRTSLGLGDLSPLTDENDAIIALSMANNLLIDNTKELRFGESDANGEQYVAIKSPDAITTSYTLTLPSAQGANNTVLVTDANGTLTWETVEAAAGNAVNAFSIIAVDGQDNLVADASQDTLNISEGSGISLITNNENGTDTLTIAVSNINNNDIVALAGIEDSKLAQITLANKVSLSALDLDGGADIGADLVDADLIIVDDGANGTNRKSEMSRVATYIRSKDSSITTLSGLTSMGADGDMLTAEGNLTVSGNLVVNGDVTTVNTATLTVEDPLISLASGNNAADSVDIGFYGLYDSAGTDSYTGLFRDASDGKFKLFKDLQDVPTTTINTAGNGYTGAILVATLEGDVTGNADTATALENERTIGGVAFDGTANIDLPGVNTAGNQDTSGNAATATEATNITVSANNDTDETVYLTFVDGATGTQGIETDTDLTYNPNSGVLTSSSFAGSLSGNSSTATALETARSIGLGGDLGGSANFDGTAGITINATIQQDAVENIMLANDGWTLSLAGVDQEDIKLGDTLDFNGTANRVTVAYDADNQDLTFSLPDTINVATSGNAATASQWATSRRLTLGGDLEGNVLFNGSQDFTLTATVGNQKITNEMLADDAVGAAELAANAVVNASIDADAAIDLDKLDWTSESAVLTDFAQDDKLFLYDTDATVIKSMTLSNLENAIFGNITSADGDISIAEGGEASIGVGKVTNVMLAGSIENGKLENNTVSFGGIELSLGGSDATPAFNLQDATNLPTSALTGTISNDKLAGSISNDKLLTIESANKVSVSAINLTNATAVNESLLATDLILVHDISVDNENNSVGNKKATLANLVTFLQNNTSLTSLNQLTTVGTISSGEWQGTEINDAYVANDLTISGGTVNNSVIGGTSPAAGTFTTLTGNTSLTINGSTAITSIDTDISNVSENNDTLATAKAIKTYVDEQITAQDLDFQADAGGALSIDLDSETLTIAGGTGIDTLGEDNRITVSIDSTVATLAGAQTFTGIKTHDALDIFNAGITVKNGNSSAGFIELFENSDNGNNKTTLVGSANTDDVDVTLTLPAATDTLVGKATTDTLTNKTIAADDGTNSITGLQTSNFKDDVLDTSLTTTADTDTTIPSAKAVKTYVDGKVGRFGGIFKTDSVDANGNYDVIFSSDPIVRSHFGPFTFNLKQLITENGSDIEFFGATAFGASDRHFEVMPTTDADDDTYGAGETVRGHCLFRGADANTP